MSFPQELPTQITPADTDTVMIFSKDGDITLYAPKMEGTDKVYQGMMLALICVHVTGSRGAHLGQQALDELEQLRGAR